LRTALVHNDANDHNVLVREDLEGQAVAGIIDFGDMLRSYVLGEVAIAAAYAMLGKRDPIGAAARVLAGYHREHPVPEEELLVLLDLIRLRLATSVSISARRARTEPENDYLFVSEAPAWKALDELSRVPEPFALALFREACGLPTDPVGVRVGLWLEENVNGFAPVLGEPLGAGDVAPVDLSVGSAEVDELSFSEGVEVASARLAERRARERVRALAGGYGEARDGYSTDAYLVPGEDRSEARTIHLGVDVWIEAGTPVCAPLAGEVVGLADNTAPLDYGPTVILCHQTDAGDAFRTLYGHLDPGCLEELAPGRKIAAGERIGAVGESARNGGWPPHLHLQVFTDPLGYSGDFPGVAPPSQRRVWESLCPDPGPLLGAARPAPAGAPSPDALWAARADRLGPSLSLSYRRPLTIVRGRGTRLFDHEGRAYLDAVNNVPHVGHSHPRVVAAGRAQMGVLNTNTRYLHPLITRYAERLAATLPESLEIFFFVCTGSEANELALRMARSHTGARDVVVVEAGYHGNTRALVELSSYKFRGAGGFQPPEHVHETPLPDPYRGHHRGSRREVGERYAADVRATVDRLVARGRRPAAFLHETLVGCGGQVVPPPGWLPGAYEAVRGAGGVCIADEVQTGFGRSGEHFWSFELQGVVPDVVTMGKPMGNGHPLAAVATTREVAASFATGMEYFNTFGGNPVSCSIGLAVLDVLEDERLQENARHVGAELLDGLRGLADRHRLVGDVRGVGLYVGVELVLDRDARTPAGTHAAQVAERMKDRGVLISTDGPDHNVLKIKPPLCFSEADAAELVATLDATLGETALSI
jgi:4-aminobutyrate aminotransferase-like enzyme